MPKPTFQRNIQCPTLGLKWQSWEVVDFYRVRGKKAKWQQRQKILEKGWEAQTESSGKQQRLSSINNREGTFSKNRSWKPVIYYMRERKQTRTKKTTHSRAPTPHWDLLQNMLLVWTFSWYSMPLVGPSPCGFLPLNLYKPSTSQLCHLIHKDGDSTFL
jgi:hypothetical protein